MGINTKTLSFDIEDDKSFQRSNKNLSVVFIKFENEYLKIEQQQDITKSSTVGDILKEVHKNLSNQISRDSLLFRKTMRLYNHESELGKNVNIFEMALERQELIAKVL